MSAPDETSNVFDAREFLRNLTARPGVYRMLNAESEVEQSEKACLELFSRTPRLRQNRGDDETGGAGRGDDYQFRG